MKLKIVANSYLFPDPLSNLSQCSLDSREEGKDSLSMAVVPKCCACASYAPTTHTQHLIKPPDQPPFSSSLSSLYGHAKSRTMGLVLSEESKKLHIGSVKASACASTDTTQTQGNRYSDLPHEESTSGSLGLLMENLNEIEAIFSSKEMDILERDILRQIERLGVLKSFHECLSQNLALTPLKQDFQQSELPLEIPKEKVTVVRSRKSQERKSKRTKGSSKRVNNTEPYIFKPHKANMNPQKCHQRILSFGWRRTEPVTAKEQRELSEGIKVASKLERIREVIEIESGRPVSDADWAKAANLDTGTLRRLLLHGSYCRDQLVQCTRPLVIYLVKKYIGLGIAPDDLLQAGILGVLKGAEKFDGKKGHKFSGYIKHWIKKCVVEHIARHSRIFRMSVRAENMVQKIEKAQRELRCNLGRRPRDEETAEFTGLSLVNVRLARRCSRYIMSLEQPIGHEPGLSLKDIIPDRSEEGRSSLKRKKLKEGLLFILEELKPREKQILEQRYGLNDGTCRSLEEIGKHFGVTNEWIRQIEKGAIAKLRRDDIKDNIRIILHL